MISIPDKYDFAFLVVDDTDCARLPEIAEVYEVLHGNGLKTNKTVWVFPPRDEPKNFGDSLCNPKYITWLKKIQAQGFEIGLHNVGSGAFIREEIIEGIEKYSKLLGCRPRIHVNHSYNPDNIYSGEERFSPIFSKLLKIFYPKYRGFEGNVRDSKFFWGDIHKRMIDYSRNVELPSLNFQKFIPNVPFIYADKREYSNYWYPATFAPNPWLWKKLVTPKEIEKLKRDRGAAIIYTHFGYYHLEEKKLDENFRKTIEYLGSQNGWYVTLSEFLDYQLEHSRGLKRELSRINELFLDSITIYTRLKYRYIHRLDDYHFKKKVGLKW